MYLLHLQNYPIFEQLQLEEALLRLDERNICLINEGSSPAIVMGISGNVDTLIHKENLKKNPIPIIKRFSGGGTVVVDENTLFISFICQKDYHSFSPFPEYIMRWTQTIYQAALNHPDFALKENDYVLKEKKFGGNAQYIQKNRWLHHSTLLWDYQKEHMDLLLHPPKTPSYRGSRSHGDFLTPLSMHVDSKQTFIDNFKQSLKRLYFIQEITLNELKPLLEKPHRKSTQILSIEDIHPNY